MKLHLQMFMQATLAGHDAHPPTVQPEASPYHPADIRPANGLGSPSAALYNGQIPDNAYRKWTMVGDEGL